MSNAVIQALTSEQELVITSDNSGAIGEKAQDVVNVPNTTVGYYACRVAIMECLAVQAEPCSVVMQNFTDEEAWSDYKRGVDQVMDELEQEAIPITGSTESNFSGLQSGLGITIIGTRPVRKKLEQWTGEERFAVIGSPLVGEEVVEKPGEIAPLSLFQKMCQMEEVKGVLPVGSKGIEATWRNWKKRESNLMCHLDLKKPAGPATCFLIAFDERDLEIIQRVSGSFFYILRTFPNSYN